MDKRVINAMDVVAPIIELVVSQAVKLVLDEFNKNSPQDARLTVVSLYPLVDVKLEPIVEKTDTEVDDALVHGIMAGIEMFANSNKIDLPNLDED